MTDETQIARLFAQAFTALDALRQRSPAAAASLSESVAAHLRSSAPLVIGQPAVPTPEIERELKDGSRYKIAAVGDCVVMTLSHSDAALNALEAIRLRSDVADVAATIGARV